MDSRQRIRTIIAGERADRCGFWLGNPHDDTWPRYHAYFGTSTQEGLQQQLGSDLCWIAPGLYEYEDVYQHPRGEKLFQVSDRIGVTHYATHGPFAECDDIDKIEAYDWPNPDYLDFTRVLAALRNAGDYYRASGFWAPFFHHLMDLFGMENYLINMYLKPDLVHAATDRVCEFYYEANERFFEAAGDLIDGFFFGNDFGTQRGLIVGPKQFDEFIAPWLCKFTAQAHRHGYQVILHSCGSIHAVIDRLIEMGVDCLHPLQAKAVHMDAETLARDFKGRIAFMGGIDTQELLVRATPQEVKAEVRRVKELLGPYLIVGPSHEALLPNVPPENVQAMAEAALE